MASQSIDVSSILGGIFGGISKHVADHYNQYLYNHAKLKDLPNDNEGPRFVFNATSLQTGVLWRFSKPFMGDWKVGLDQETRTSSSLRRSRHRRPSRLCSRLA